MPNLSTRRLPSSLVPFLLAIAGLVGCADDNHPATESSSESLSETGTGSGSASTALAAESCAPGAARECKKFWNDIHGRLHCILETQICRADGYGWQACGDTDAGVAADAGTEADSGHEGD